MIEIIEQLTSLQKKLEYKNQERFSNLDENQETLVFSKTHDGFLKIYYYGTDSREEVFLFLSNQEYAKQIRSLRFDSPDEGANGTNNFDFSTLTESNAIFPNLRNFAVKLTQLEDHNGTIIGDIYEEDGQVAKLIKKMPNLLSLQIPSAPNSDFFDFVNHPLELLTVQTGFDHQNFILNFSESTYFPKLRYLDFTDYQETYVENWQNECVPFDHFVKLFSSSAFDSIRLIILRNVNLTTEQIAELKSLRKNISFRLIKTSSNYV